MYMAIESKPAKTREEEKLQERENEDDDDDDNDERWMLDNIKESI